VSKAVLKAGLYFISIAAMAIGTAIALLGINPVGQFFNTVISIVYNSGPLTELGTPNDDSELRFYSVFFVAYGAIFFQTTRNLAKHSHRLPLLLGLFFLGGIARSISYVTVGQPHALFVLLMVIELTMPPLLYLCWLITKRV